MAINFLELSKRTITAVLLLLVLGFTFYSIQLTNFLIALILLFVLFTEWPRLAKNKAMWLLTPLYPVVPMLLLLSLNNSIYRDLYIPMILFTATFDTASYISGKFFGKHKLIPSISPGKTWQGLIGGWVSAIAIVACWMHFEHPFFIISHVTIVSFIALAGDLFESFLKRKAGIKDSGNLLPGHGGILDRIDSYLFVIIYYWFCRVYLSNYLL